MAGQQSRHKSLVPLGIRGVPELDLVHERVMDRSEYSRMMAVREALLEESPDIGRCPRNGCQTMHTNASLPT